MIYDSLASEATISRTAQALKVKNYKPIVVDTGEQALEKIKEIIPIGASVMNGSSRTLEQIGYIDYLKSETHPWNNLHAAIVAEKDPVKQSFLRKQSSLSDYYLGSVHALIETGEFVIASNSGSQLPHIVFTSPNLIFIVSTQKIVADFSQAMERLEKHVVPLENENMMQKYAVGTKANKILIFNGENPMLGRKISVILVKEKLGF